MKFLKVVGVFAAVVLFGVFYTVKAASDYGASHDMSTEVNVEDILSLDPAQTWETFCDQERDPSWDSICERRLELPSIRDAISNAEVFLDNYAS